MANKLKDTESGPSTSVLFSDEWIYKAPETLRDVIWFSTLMERICAGGEVHPDMKKVAELMEFSMETIGKCYQLVTGRQIRTEDSRDDPFTVQRLVNAFGEAMDKIRKPAGGETIESSSSDSGVDEKQRVDVDFGRKREFTSVKKRAYSCPSCSKAVRDVRRHLAQAHRWTPEKISSCFERTCESKGKNPKRECSFDQCSWIGTRFDRHFESEHGLSKRKDPFAYKRMLRLLKPLTRNSQPDPSNGQDEETKKIVSAKEKIKEKEQCDDDDDDDDDDDVYDYDGRGGDDKADGDNDDDGDDDDDDDLQDYKDQKSKLSPSFQMLLREFYKWLTSPHGGDTDPKPANQKVQQVETVARAIAGERNVQSIEQTFGGVPDVIWEAFFQKKIDERREYEEAEDKSGLKKGLKAASLQMYSYALTDFIRFLEGEDKVDELSTTCVKNLMKTKDAQEKWRSALCKRKTKQNNARQHEEDEVNITFEELQAVFSAEKVKECPRKLLDEGIPKQFGSEESAFLRNYVATCLLLENCARASLISGMTIKEFRKRKVMKDQDGNDKYVIHVFNHKTAAKAGAMACIMTPKTEQILNSYVTNIRSGNPGADVCKNVFLNENGTDMRSEQVHRNLYSFVRQSGAVPRLQKLSPTDLRKLWVTWDRSLATSTAEHSELLATFMQHQKRTADKWYDKRSKTKKSLQASKIISGQVQKLNLHDDQPSTSHHQPSPSTPIRIKQEEEEPNERFMKRGPYFTWKKSEEAILFDYFRKNIENSSKPPSRKLIREQFDDASSDSKVFELWNRNDSPVWKQRCINKVRSLYRSFMNRKLKASNKDSS